MKCKYCDDKVYFSATDKKWVHVNSQGEYYFHCDSCGFYATCKRYLETCPTCGEALKVHHIAYPVPEEEEKKT
mgnify:CR=1 FL=1